MKLSTVLKQIEKHKLRIGVERDKLRVILDDLETCLESFDAGIEGLDSGRAEIEYALDRISEVV